MLHTSNLVSAPDPFHEHRGDLKVREERVNATLVNPQFFLISKYVHNEIPRARVHMPSPAYIDSECCNYALLLCNITSESLYFLCKRLDTRCKQLQETDVNWVLQRSLFLGTGIMRKV